MDNFLDCLRALGSNRMIYFSSVRDHLFLKPGCWAVALLAGASFVTDARGAPPAAITKEPIVIDSVVSTMDESTNTADFTTISVTQGKTRLTADRASATGLGFQNSQWTFTGRVVITLEPRCSFWADQAVLEYRDGELKQVTASGSQARFEQQRTDTQQAQKGQADQIIYDPKQGTVRLRGHAQILSGDSTEMRAPTFVYHVKDGRLQGVSENGTPAVHMTIRQAPSLVPP